MKAFATLIGTVFLLIIGAKALTNGAVQVGQKGAYIDYNALVKTGGDFGKPFAESLKDMQKRKAPR